MLPFRLIINGSRHYRCYFKFARAVDTMLKNIKPENILIIAGEARGVDRLAKIYAKRRKLRYLGMPADWDKYQKAAGFVRNKEMMEIATHVLSFWDGESKGTGHVVREASNYNLSLRVIKIPKDTKHGKP